MRRDQVALRAKDMIEDAIIRKQPINIEDGLIDALTVIMRDVVEGRVDKAARRAMTSYEDVAQPVNPYPLRGK
jgi:hypothetical protein